jgi:uracil-DNA glycosylase
MAGKDKKTTTDSDCEDCVGWTRKGVLSGGDGTQRATVEVVSPAPSAGQVLAVSDFVGDDARYVRVTFALADEGVGTLSVQEQVVRAQRLAALATLLDQFRDATEARLIATCQSPCNVPSAPNAPPPNAPAKKTPTKPSKPSKPPKPPAKKKKTPKK